MGSNSTTGGSVKSRSHLARHHANFAADLCKMSCHQLVWAAAALGLILVFCGAQKQYPNAGARPRPGFTESLKSYQKRCRNANGRAVEERCPTCASCQLGWCTRKCNVERNPECCYNIVCQMKRPDGCFFTRFL